MSKAIRWFARNRWALILGVALPLLESFIVLLPIVRPEGYVFYGDSAPLTNPWLTLQQSLSLWNFQSQGGVVAPFIWSPFYLAYALFTVFLGPAATSRVMVVLLGGLPGVTMYCAASRLYVIFRRSPWPSEYALLFSLTASQVFELSFVNTNLTDPLNPWGIAYLTLPLLFIGSWLVVVEGKKLGIPLLLAGALASSLNPFWIEELAIVAVPILGICLPELTRKSGFKTVLKRTVVGISTLILASLFWIVPLAYEYGVGVASYSQAAVPSTYGSLVYESQGYRLLDVLLYGHSTYSLFGTWYQNWTLLSLIPCLLTFIPLLTPRAPKRALLALYFSLLLGLFLSKGANPPWGYSFYWLYLHLPAGFGELLRNGGNIFLATVLFAGALLLAVAVLELASTLSKLPGFAVGSDSPCLSSSLPVESRGRARSSLRRLWPILFSMALLIGILYPLAGGMAQDRMVYGPRFVAAKIPPGYASTNTYLEDQGYDFNVGWVPNGCCLVPYWKPYLSTNFPASISYETSVPSVQNYMPYVFVPGSNNTGDSLALLGTRYLVVHNDFEGFPADQWYGALNASSQFSKAYASSNLTVYQVMKPWIPSEVYVLPSVGETNSGFPYFNGESYVNISAQGQSPTGEGNHNASKDVFAQFNGSSWGAGSQPLNFSSGQNFTVMAWVRTNSLAPQVIAQDNVYGGTWNGWVLGLLNGAPYFQAGQTSSTQFQGLVANTSIADGQWHMVVGERSGSTWDIYVDGQLVAQEGGMTSVSTANDQPFSVGARVTSYGGYTWFFNGYISDVQAYGEGLSVSSIADLYQHGMSGYSVQGLLAGWLLQQTSGNQAASLVPGGVPLTLSNVSWAPAYSTLNFGAGQDFAIGAWVRTESPTTQVIVQDNVYGGTWDGWILGLERGYPYFQAGQTSSTEFQGLVSNSSVANGMWTFLLGERIGNDWFLYVNGRLSAEARNKPSVQIETNQSASIGARVTAYGGNTWFFQGAIGDVQIYSEGLNSSRVMSLYDSGLAPRSPPIGHNHSLLFALTENFTAFSLEDNSPNHFSLKAFGGVLADVLPLPLYTGSPNSSSIRVDSVLSQTQSSWVLALHGHGEGTVVLAEPFTPGWTLTDGSRKITGQAVLSGLGIGFNVTVFGNARVALNFGPQVFLYVGIAGSLVGFAALGLMLIRWPSLLHPKRPREIRPWVRPQSNSHT